MRQIKIGLIGYGYWGPNLARNIAETPQALLVTLAEKFIGRRQAAISRYPRLQTTADYRELTDNPGLDAVVVATPVSTHYEIVRRALLNGKHVWVEKPIAASVKEGAELVRLAKRNRRVLLVDHTFVYTPAVRKMKELVSAKSLGDIYYFDSVRINLGLFQSDVNVVWDLAPHDLSIMQYVLGAIPDSVAATGAAHSRLGKESVAYISMKLKGGILAHLHVNWLSPVKIRRTILGGSRRMLVYDDLDSDEKIKIFDRGVDFISSRERIYKELVKYRTGDMRAPYVEKQEALRIEAAHFVDCILKGKRPMTGGEEGLDVVRVLEAIDRSLAKGGARARV